MPYGSTVGYVNLFYVAPRWRRLGIGRRLHGYAQAYARSWEAAAVELHVGPANAAAVEFYRSLGYRLSDASGGRLWRMRLDLTAVAVDRRP